MGAGGVITGAEVAAILLTGRFTLQPEAQTQAEIETFLAARLPLGCGLSREHRLSAADRPDFMVDGRIAVEVKCRGQGRRAIFRQLERYAAHPEVTDIVIATNVSLAEAPPPAWRDLKGKRLFYVALGRGWL